MPVKEEEQEVQEEEDKPQPPSETILEKQEQRDPDEMVFAEQAIHHYATDVLDQFRDSVENALTNFEGWLSSQNGAENFNDRMFTENIGQVFLDMIMGMMGGKDSPIAQAFYVNTENAVDVAARQEVDATLFVNELSRSTRDFTWYLRDNLQSVLSNQWDELRDLAYEGSTDFIPLLHAYGLPEGTIAASEINAPLLEASAQYIEAIPKKKEEIEQGDIDKVATEEAKMEEDPTAIAFEEEEKQSVV